MSDPEVSVIIPTFNRVAYVQKAIASVLQQTFQDHEVIVIDDGSTDGTTAALRVFGAAIRVIQQANMGVSSARNAGLSAARGKWIAFLDSDDEWCPAKLETQMRDLARYPSAVAHSCNALFVGAGSPETDLFALRKYSQANNPAFIERAFCVVLWHGLASLPCYVVRRDVALQTSGFDTTISIYEDLAFLLELSLRGPMVTNHDILARFVRRNEQHDLSLTLRARRNRRECLVSMLGILNRFAKRTTITGEERLLLRQTTSNTTRELALLSSEEREFMSALRLLYKSWLLDPTPKTGLKCLASMMPFGIGGWLRRIYGQRWKQRELWRT